MAEFDARSIRGKAAGSNDLADLPAIGERNALAVMGPGHPLDSEESRDELRKLMQWYFYERDRQSANRLEMATDHDFYDNLQWDEADAAVLADRGQMPLVYNEVAPMCDWIIGTERRNRVDWKVLPRTEDDVDSADTKTNVLKYVSDINRVPFTRSRAFADAIKGGVGWIDDGACDDPTKDIIYSRYEDWRNVLWDSSSNELDLSDARYVFRWRWVDEDIACLMFPDRADVIRKSVNDWSYHVDPQQDEDTWTTPHDQSNSQAARSGSQYAVASGYVVDSTRKRVKLIECQYTKPARVKVVSSGPFKGAYFNPEDQAMATALGAHGGSIIDKMAMRQHVAVFTDSDMLGLGVSIYRHNRFSLTPIWCYRRSRDRQPYGAIRRVRDIQKDLNKRASKALWLLNTNQIIADEGAVDDIEVAREEAQMPDGYIATKAGKKFEIKRDTDAATGQLQIMAMDAQSIQKSAGVNQENMGRQSNAVSGEAIKARQMQGAVSTTEPFDNLRLTVQVQGEKQLSLVEQFYTEEKVIRLTGAKGALNWVHINQPEQQPDGSIRYINDITASMADFVVSEQDYAGTLRQVLFDSLNQMAQRLPPEVSMRLLTIAMDFSDLPNKDEIAGAIRKLTGEQDPSKKLTPEEQQQQQQAMQQQEQAMQVQQAMTQGALEEQAAKVRQLNAQAANLEAQAQQLATSGQGGDGAGQVQYQIENAVRAVQEQAANQIEDLTRKLAAAQSDNTHKVLAVNKDADTKMALGRINAAATVQVAEIAKNAEKSLEPILKRMDDIARSIDELRNDTADTVDEVHKVVDDKVKKVAESIPPAPKEAPAPAPVAAAPVAPAAPAAPAHPPVVVNVQPPAPPMEMPKPPKNVSVVFKYDAAGDVAGATVKRDDGSTTDVALNRPPAIAMPTNKKDK